MKTIHRLLVRLTLILTLFALPAAHAAPGDVDPLDAAVVGNYVLASAVQPDGKTIIAGNFTSVLGQSRNNVARLNADGTLDAGFNPDVNGTVWSVAVQADGRILLGGDFTTVGGTARNFIARVDAAGALDAGFNPNANSSIYSVAVQADGRVLLGGAFTSVGGTARNYIARVDAAGVLDAGFNPNANDAVFSVAVQADGRILLGGSFTTVGGTARNFIARVDAAGALDAGFNPNANFFVYSVVVQADGRILLGGVFSSVGGTARNCIARVDAAGTIDAGFNPNVDNVVLSMAVQADGRILLGGYFSSVGGTARNYIARVDAAGVLEAGFNPDLDGGVWSVAVQVDGKILLGGNFTTVGGTARNTFARLLNDPATQTLSAPDATQLTWTRGGSSPEVSLVTFEKSTDGGATWTPLGSGTRIGTTPNWQLTGLALPATGQLRACGRTTGGFFNGSSGLVEATASFSFAPPNTAPMVAVDAVSAAGFTGAGSMATGRYVHGAALLGSGKVLVAGGYNSAAGERLASAELFDPATGSWSATASMSTKRQSVTLTALANGKALAVGGFSNAGPVASAELYDPATASWSLTGNLSAARHQHTATLLANGQVLVVGGSNFDGTLSSAELYDPATATWSATGSLSAVRKDHTATLLADGRVLVTGGVNDSGQPQTGAELYDPATGSWSAAANPPTVRTSHTATLLADGRVLVAGGSNNLVGPLRSAELYDPATGNWSAAADLPVIRVSHTATLLPNGTVLATGGSGAGDYATAVIYDPATDSWSATGSLATARNRHTATLLANGTVLVATGSGAGGSDVVSAELFRPAVLAATASEGSAGTRTGTFADANGNATATLTASSGTVTQDNAAGTWSWTATGEDGPATPTITITATDTASATGMADFTFTVTNVAPTVAISAPTTANEDASVNFTFTATDASSADQTAGFAWVLNYGDGSEYTFAAGTPSPLSLTYTYTNPGTYTVTATATDKDSGTSLVATRGIIITDATAPETTITSGPSGTVDSDSATFDFSADEEATFTYSLDGGATAVGAGPVTFDTLANGTHTFSVFATDTAGNVDATPATQTWTVALDPGTLSFVSATPSANPVNGSGALNTVPVLITRSGGTAGAITVEVVPSQPATTPSGFAKYVYGTDYQFVSGTAAGSTVSFADGQASATVDVLLKTPVLTKKGQFKLTLGAMSGGASPGATTVALVTINARDAVKPTVVITTPAATVAAPGTFNLTGTVKDDGASDLSLFTVTLNGGTVTPTRGAYLVNTAVTFSANGLQADNGTNTLVVTARDAQGNTTVMTKTFTCAGGSLSPALAGTYSGLLVASGTPDNNTSGFFTATITSTAVFTGKVTLGGIAVPIKGVLSNEGVAKFTATTTDFDLIDKVEFDTYLGSLRFTIPTTGGNITATLSTQATGGSLIATATATKNAFDATRLVATANADLLTVLTGTPKGVYNVSLPNEAQPVLTSSQFPQGDGVGILTLSNTGVVTLIGNLADGTAYSASGNLKADLTAPLHVNLYKLHGSLAGTFQLEPGAVHSDVSGANFLWLRPALPAASAYKVGWPNGVTLSPVGTKFVTPTAGSVLPSLLAVKPTGNAMLDFTGGLLSPVVSKSLNIAQTTANTVTKLGGDTSYALNIVNGTGAFSGSFTHTGKSVAYKGIILNKGGNVGGFGYFLSPPPASTVGGAEGGSVTLTAKP